MLKLLRAKGLKSFCNYIWWPTSQKLKTPGHWSLVTGHWKAINCQLLDLYLNF